MRTSKRSRQRGKRAKKRSFKLQGKHEKDFLIELRDKLENEHIKKYTFVIKGSKLFTQGVFWSEKNQEKFIFRSTYEFGFFYLLENDPNVLSYIVEPFDIAYLHPKYSYRTNYKPDVLVHYKDGTIKLYEIKPKKKLGDLEVRAKAIAARSYLAENMPTVKYEFITEEQIFNSPKDYYKLLGKLDPVKYAKHVEPKEKKKQAKKAEKEEKKQVSKAVLKALDELPKPERTRKSWSEYKRPKNEHFSPTIEEYFRSKLPDDKKKSHIMVL